MSKKNTKHKKNNQQKVSLNKEKAAPKNLKEKMKQDQAAAHKQAATTKAPEQKQSWWQKAKNKIKGAYNTVKTKGVKASVKDYAKKAVTAVKQNKYVHKVADSKLGKAVKRVANSKVGKAVRVTAKFATRVVTTPVRWAWKVSTTPIRYTYKFLEGTAKLAYRGAKKCVDAAGKTKFGQWAKNNKVSKWVNRKVSKVAIKAFGKGLAKTTLKKIPVVSVIVGAGLAAKEAWNGNWGRASMELASGAAGCFPPIGTAASFAIDGAIVGYDLYEAHQQKKALQAAQAEARRKAEAARQQQELEQQKQKERERQQAEQKKQQLEKEAEEARKKAEEARKKLEAKSQQQGSGEISGRSTVVNSGVSSDISSGSRGASSSGAESTEYTEVEGGSRSGGRSGGHSGRNSGARSSVSGGGSVSRYRGSSEGGRREAEGAGQHHGNENSEYKMVEISNQGNAIVYENNEGKHYEITQETLEQTMSAKRAKGTMEKLQKVVAMENQPAGLAGVIEAYIPEKRPESVGTATVNRNLIDATVKAIGGSSKVTSITIDGKKIKAKDIREAYGCTKKEAKQILKAYGRAIEDGANVDEVLREIAQGKKIDKDNSKFFATMQQYQDARAR